jgi:hypothetical protein
MKEVDKKGLAINLTDCFLMNNAAITCTYLYIWDHILLCSYDDLQLDTADQQRINQLLSQRLEEQNLQNFGLRYLNRELRRQGEKGKTSSFTVTTEAFGLRPNERKAYFCLTITNELYPSFIFLPGKFFPRPRDQRIIAD